MLCADKHLAALWCGLCCAVLCRINSEGLGDKDFSSIYRYIYGAGITDPEWSEGQRLHSSQVP